MRNRFLISILLLITIAACKKTKFATVPSLKYKSVNTKTLRNGETLKITLTFTDAEGDVIDTLLIQKVVRPCAANPRGGFKDSTHTLPTFPTARNQKGDIVITYNYTDLNPLCNRNDTAIFKFVLRDRANHFSDTAVSDPIVIIF